jgi:predicted transcriptional regulator
MNATRQEEMFGVQVARYGRKKGKRSPLKLIVLDALRAAGVLGLTVDELEKQLRLPHQSVSARVHELAHAGSIKPAKVDGKPVKRPTRMGRPAVVFVVAGEVTHGS